MNQNNKSRYILYKIPSFRLHSNLYTFLLTIDILYGILDIEGFSRVNYVNTRRRICNFSLSIRLFRFGRHFRVEYSIVLCLADIDAFGLKMRI